MKNNQEILNLIKAKAPDWVLDNTICLHYSGSMLYGTATPNSDIDVRGVCIPPVDYWITSKKFEQFKYEDDTYDITIFDIRKWLTLALSMNPNIIESAYAPDNIHIILSQQWVDIREKFIVSIANDSCFSSYFGFSTSQLHDFKKNGKLKSLMHAFRVLEQGTELLSTGKMTFPRSNAKELLDIRSGVKSFDNPELAWKDWDDKLKLAKDNSVLKNSKDVSVVDDILKDVFRSIYI